MPLPQNEFPFVPVWDYAKVRSEVQSGDLLFCSGTTLFAQLIKKFTRSIWSHVGIVMRLPDLDRVILMESVESVGVRAIPLSHYVANYQNTQKGYPGRIFLARHQEVTRETAKELARMSMDLLGRPYDREEVLRIALRIAEIDLDNQPRLNEAYLSSEYVYTCFKKANLLFDYNEKGIMAPADIAKDRMIEPIAEILIP